MCMDMICGDARFMPHEAQDVVTNIALARAVGLNALCLRYAHSARVNEIIQWASSHRAGSFG
jgi:hypothetical protein